MNFVQNKSIRGVCGGGLEESAAGQEHKAEIVVPSKAEKSLVSIAVPAQKKISDGQVSSIRVSRGSNSEALYRHRV